MGVSKKKSVKKWKPSNHLIERVHGYIRDGMRASEIKAMLLVESDDLTDKQFETLIDEAYVVAEMALMKDREYAFQLHMNRYEALYEDSMKLVNEKGIPLVYPRDFPIIRARYIAALIALQNKEDLIGLHDKSMVLEFNDQKATVIEHHDGRGNATIGFDFDKLTLAEKKELLELIRGCRSVPIEGIERVVIKQTKIEINTGTGERNEFNVTKNIDNVNIIQDIEFEEMPEDVVSKIEDTTPIEDEPVKPKEMIEDLTGGLLEQKKSASNILEELKRKMGNLS